MNHRNPFNKAYDPNSLLSGIDNSIGEEIFKALVELVQVRIGDSAYPILYLDYQQLHLGDAGYLLTKFEHLEAQLLLGEKSERLLIKVTQDIWTSYFEIIHGNSGSLLAIHRLLEPLWIGSRLDRAPPNVHALTNSHVYTGPNGSHLTYYKSRDCTDYCRIGFSDKDSYKEVVWTKKGIMTRQHSFQTQASNVSEETQLMLEAALMMLGMKEDQAQLDLQYILQDLLVQTLFRKRYPAGYAAS